jgi:hypothetical protein
VAEDVVVAMLPFSLAELLLFKKRTTSLLELGDSAYYLYLRLAQGNTWRSIDPVSCVCSVNTA